MGLAKHGRLPVAIGLAMSLLVFGILPWPMGCNSKKNSVTSSTFMAPQPDISTARVIISRIAILREARRTNQGVPLDSEIANTPCRLYPIGKIDDAHLIVFESESKTILSIEIETGLTTRVMTRDEFLALFDNQAQRPTIGSVIRMQNGWLLGYEKTTKYLFAMRANQDGNGITAIQVMTQNEMQNQIFPPDFTNKRTQISIKNMIEFEPNEILIVSENPEVTALHHLRIEDKVDYLEASFIQQILEPNTGEYEFVPFVAFDEIRVKTSNNKVDVKDFPPVKIPNSNSILIFDRAKDTSSFIIVNYTLLPPEVIIPSPDAVPVSRYSTSLDITVRRSALLTALEEANKGGTAFTGEFKFSASFLHPDAGKSSDDLSRKPLVFAFDEETNNMFSYDFSKAIEEEKVTIFTSSTMLSERSDFNYDATLDSGTFDPVLKFAEDNVTDNKIAFDAGPGQLIAFNYLSGQVVVVLHKRDVTNLTGIGLANLSYIEALDANELRVIDFESGSILGVHVNYIPVPYSYPKGH